MMVEDDAALSTCANANTSGRLVVIGKIFKRVVMKDITVVKVWDDRDDQDGIRPASITVTASDGTTAQLSAENNWTATVSVRKYDSQGEITYTWEEKELRTEAPGYTLVSAVTEGDTTTLTNRHEAEVTSVSVRKIWDDDGNRDGIRPESITVTLSDGQTATLSEANGWAARIDHLPKFAEGEEITYSWTEASVEGYTTTSVTEGDTTTLTNRHEPETTTATITKVWDDDNNRDGIRPETLTVTLRANGTTAATETLNAGTDGRRR